MLFQMPNTKIRSVDHQVLLGVKAGHLLSRQGLVSASNGLVGAGTVTSALALMHPLPPNSPALPHGARHHTIDKHANSADSTTYTDHTQTKGVLRVAAACQPHHDYLTL